MSLDSHTVTTVDKLLASRREAWTALGIGRTRLDLLIRDGALPTVRLGKRTMIPVSALKALATPPDQRAA